MAIDHKYGEFEIPGVPADMPVFVLLAKDVTALETIGDYKDINLDRGNQDPQWHSDLDSVLLSFSNYAITKIETMKVPD